MQGSLSSLVDALSGINKKKPMDEFIDKFRPIWLHYHVFLMIYLKLIKK